MPVQRAGPRGAVYLDPDYWLAIREVTETRVRGVERVIETDLGNYAQVAGVWIPRPARYQVERIQTLERELGDVEKEIEALAGAGAHR